VQETQNSVNEKYPRKECDFVVERGRPQPDAPACLPRKAAELRHFRFAE
jgi:hypothetical protein